MSNCKRCAEFEATIHEILLTLFSERENLEEEVIVKSVLRDRAITRFRKVERIVGDVLNKEKSDERPQAHTTNP